MITQLYNYNHWCSQKKKKFHRYSDIEILVSTKQGQKQAARWIKCNIAIKKLCLHYSILCNGVSNVYVNLIQDSLYLSHTHKFMSFTSTHGYLINARLCHQEVGSQKDHRSQSRKAIKEKASSHIELCG